MTLLNRTEQEQDSIGDVFLRPELCPAIAEHALQCDSLFRKYMAMPETVPDPTLLDDQLARFTLWTSNMDIYGPLNVSLDYRLRYSPTVVDIIHQLLDVICDTLLSLKPIDDPPQTPSRKKQRMSLRGDAEVTKRAERDESDTDSEEHQAEENMSMIAYTIGGTVTRLFRLSNAIRKSAADKRAQRIERYTDDEAANKAIAELRLYTDCYIRFRFPLAPESLCSALVEANALRLRRLYYQRSHRRRIDLSMQHPQTNPGVVQLPKLADRTPVVQFAPSLLPKPDAIKAASKPSGLPVVPVTNATTARQTAVGALYAKSTTEVPRAKSVMVNNKLSFPPIPSSNECPYCGVVVEFKNHIKTMMWHDHVVKDLEPFICIFTACTESTRQGPGSLTFATSKAWMSHLQNAHGSVWECRAPSHDPITFEEEAHYQEHSREDHDVPEAHLGTLSSAARRPVHQRILQCPFGDDFQTPEKAEPSAVFSSEALHLHVAAHMKEIALLTLQKLPSDDHGDEENVESDQQLDEDGPGLAVLRGSMYSVLDDESLDFQTDRLESGDITLDNHLEGLAPSVDRLDLEDRDATGMTKLHRAVRDGNLTLVMSLIAQGENVRSTAKDGRTALHHAALPTCSGLEILRVLLNAGDKAIIDTRDKNGQSPMHLAAEMDFTNGIRLMVYRGGAVGILDNHGFSPYLWAVVAGKRDATAAFVILGVDVDSSSADGTSALGWAVSLGHKAVAELLLKNGARFNAPMTQKPYTVPLEEAAAHGNAQIVQLLLERGSDPHHRNHDGWAAIHWAADEGHVDVVRLLLSYNVDVDVVSSYGTSPLHCAANGGHKDIVSLLLRHGADPSKSTCHGWTPLHHATFMGHVHVTALLLEDERVWSDISHQDNHGWSVLHLAVLSRNLAMVIAILDHPLAEQVLALHDESGLTAKDWLHHKGYFYQKTSNLAFGKSRCCRAVTDLRRAVYEGNIPLIELLLRQGHSISGENSGKRTALYYAVKKGFLPIISMLLDHGADPNVLPTGQYAWEDFIFDYNILSQLRQAGYRGRDMDSVIVDQMRHALDAVSGQSSLRSPARSLAPAYKNPEPVGTTETSRFRAPSFWKRLRGQ